MDDFIVSGGESDGYYQPGSDSEYDDDDVEEESDENNGNNDVEESDEDVDSNELDEDDMSLIQDGVRNYINATGAANNRRRTTTRRNHHQRRRVRRASNAKCNKRQKISSSASSLPQVSEKYYFKNDVVVEDFKCPITHELPVDEPVVAMDGMVYERVAITQWISKCQEQNGGTDEDTTAVKSPWNNLPMISTNLVPAPPNWSNKLEECVNKLTNSMAAAGGKAEEDYVKTYKEKKKFKELVMAATDFNDVSAMEEIALCYQTADCGVEVDEQKAFYWYDLAYQNGSVIGMANVGDLLVCGSGTKKNIQRGTNLLFIAALKGSDYASYTLGMDFVDGSDALPMDRKLAIKFLNQCLDEDYCKYNNMDDEEKAEAKKKLEELTEN